MDEISNASGAGQINTVSLIATNSANNAINEAVNNIVEAYGVAFTASASNVAPLTAANLAAHTQAINQLFGPPTSTDDEARSSTHDGRTTFASETWTELNSSYGEFSQWTLSHATDGTDHG